jgi:ATP-dependent DNA ligase
MNKVFPPLYKLSSTGALQIWQIAVEGSTIITVHGQLGGAQQTSTDTVKEGKNAGKKNATTPETQALADAQSKWEKKKKGRYVEDMEAARAGEVDTELVQGGIPPMLSINKSYPRDPILDQYLQYPCIEQPKLDGVCCIAIVEDGKATLWSRTQKRIASMPHIVAELERLFPSEMVVFHGELYNHAYKDRFEDLISIIRKDEPDAEGMHKVVQLHVYDIPNAECGHVAFHTPYRNRYSTYQGLLKNHKAPVSSIVVPVDGNLCSSFEELKLFYEARLQDGYEGSMAKNLDGKYASGKRSHNLLKMKEFEDGEMIILEVLDGRGKDASLASKIRGEFTGPTGKKVIVEPTIACSYEKKREYWEKREYLKGKKATIKFKRLTADGVPYIPSVIWKSIREYD